MNFNSHYALLSISGIFLAYCLYLHFKTRLILDTPEVKFPNPPQGLIKGEGIIHPESNEFLSAVSERECVYCQLSGDISYFDHLIVNDNYCFSGTMQRTLHIQSGGEIIELFSKDVEDFIECNVKHYSVTTGSGKNRRTHHLYEKVLFKNQPIYFIGTLSSQHLNQEQLAKIYTKRISGEHTKNFYQFDTNKDGKLDHEEVIGLYKFSQEEGVAKAGKDFVGKKRDSIAVNRIKEAVESNKIVISDYPFEDLVKNIALCKGLGIMCFALFFVLACLNFIHHFQIVFVPGSEI